MMNRTIFTCIAVSAISISSKISAQQGELIEIDSLSKIVNNPKISRQEKILPMAELSKRYSDEGDSLKAKKFLNQARTLARKQKDSKYMIYIFSRELPNILNSHPRNVTGAYKIIDSVYAAISKTTDREAQAMGYYSIGYTKNFLDSKYDFDDFFKSLRIVEKLPEKSKVKYKWLAYIYSSLYARSNIRDKTYNIEKYLNLMYQAAEKSENKNVICNAMYAKLNYIAFMKNPPEDKNVILQNAKRLEQYISKNGNNINAVWYGRAVNVLKNVYADYPNAQSEKLIEQYTENFKKNVRNNVQSKIALLYLIINDEEQKKNYAKTIELYKEQLIPIRKVTQPYLLSRDYENLSLLYTEIGQHRQATEAMNESLKYYKELVNIQTEEQHQLAEVKFEVEKIKLEAAKKQAALSLARSRNVLYLVVGLSIAGFLISLVLFFNRRNKRLKFEKEYAEQQTKLKEYERDTAQKKLVAANLQVIKKNETLEKITQKSTDREIQKLVRKDFVNDKIYIDSEKIFENIHPEFFEFLREKATPNKLTNLDLRYCAYIYLQKGNKEISHELNVSTLTVKTNKRRLLKKFNLKKQADFQDLFGIFSSPD
ncbi:MAG: LuxR family transcriptional regulator [Flavobacteriaceae bacterium]|jgi:DNA-binding CsgD family transcriptional regulator|nr:LuxR family transcriptional regulator [Flavobacteriaceae bacterium]